MNESLKTLLGIGIVLAQLSCQNPALADGVDPLSVITNVSQLRDVSPTDWATEAPATQIDALKSLNDRYACLTGYPNRTFRGNKALTRWEFAAGLNVCINAMERSIQNGMTVSRADIDTLIRLQGQFEPELALVGTRIDNLDGRTAFLENHQFSTTTTLRGEAIFAVSNAWEDSFAVDSRFPTLSPSQQESLRTRPVGNQTTFSDRVRLSLNTSFTGRDRLNIRLEAGNVPNLGNTTGSDMARLSFESENNNNVFLEQLYYKNRIDRFQFWIGARGLGLNDVFNVVNPVLESGGSGALSRFNQRNPLVYRGPSGAGVGLKYQFSPIASLTALYLSAAETVSDPSQGNGLFNGNFSTGVQFDLQPSSQSQIAFTYVHSYFSQLSVDLSGRVGSPITRDPFGGLSASSRDSFGLQAYWQIDSVFGVGGWIGYGTANATEIDSSAELWTWQLNLSARDILKEGAIFTLAGGQLPRAGYVQGFIADRDTSYLVETQYQYPITDNILLTPGVYVIFNPNHYSQNGTIVVGVVRTTFRF